MYFENISVASVIEKTACENEGHYGSSINNTRRHVNICFILRIISIVFCIITLLSGINGCISITDINESSSSYSRSDFHYMTHISIVANEKSYDITYLQITEETSRNVKLNVFKEFTHIFQNANYPFIKELLQLIIYFYYVQWNNRRKKRNLGK